MTVLEMTRVDRITRTYTLATLFPNLAGPFSTAGIAILPRRVNPVGGTVFTPLAITGGAVTVTYAGPDASSTGAVVVTGSGDAHIEITTSDGQVDTAKVETLLLAGGGTVTPLPSTYVTSVAGLSGTVSAQSLADQTATPLGAKIGVAGNPLGDAARAAFLLPATGPYAWNGDGTLSTDSTGKTYAYNSDGTLHTETLNGTTRTYSYNADGTIASVA